MIGFLGQPILFFLALGFGFGPIYQRAGGGDFIQFLAPGIIAMTTLFSSMFVGMEVIWDRQFGFLKETLVAPVSRGKIMLGKTLGGATVAFLQGIIIFIITLIFGFRPTSWAYFPIALVFMFLIAFLFTAFGIAIASQLEDMQGFPIIMNFIIMPIFFVSGALFPLEGLPKAFLFVTRLDPLTYGVDGLRWALTGASHLNVGIDLAVILAVLLAVFSIGKWAFGRVEV